MNEYLILLKLSKFETKKRNLFPLEWIKTVQSFCGS